MSDRTCSVKDCERDAVARTLCPACYMRAKKRGTLPPKQRRPLPFTLTPNGCWEWRGRSDTGYGAAGWNGEVNAHRSMYRLMLGPIPPGMELDHLCRNRACCNPDHLEVVTHRENVLRGDSPAAHHARQTHCVNGHEFTPDNIYSPPRGGRQCRACKRERDVLYGRRNRARAKAQMSRV